MTIAVLWCAVLSCAVLCCAVLSGVLRSAVEKGRNRDTCSSFSHRDCRPGVGGHTFSVAWVLWSDKVEVPYTEIRTERDGSLSLILIPMTVSFSDAVSSTQWAWLLQNSTILQNTALWEKNWWPVCVQSVRARYELPIFKGEIIRLHSYTVCSDVPGIASDQQ